VYFTPTSFRCRHSPAISPSRLSKQGEALHIATIQSCIYSEVLPSRSTSHNHPMKDVSTTEIALCVDGAAPSKLLPEAITANNNQVSHYNTPRIARLIRTCTYRHTRRPHPNELLLLTTIIHLSVFKPKRQRPPRLVIVTKATD